jgi:hypothetical protein
MVEKSLFSQLKEFNVQQENVYRDQWGSFLTFIDDKTVSINGRPMEVIEAIKLQILAKQSGLRPFAPKKEPNLNAKLKMKLKQRFS